MTEKLCDLLECYDLYMFENVFNEKIITSADTHEIAKRKITEDLCILFELLAFYLRSNIRSMPKSFLDKVTAAITNSLQIEDVAYPNMKILESVVFRPLSVKLRNLAKIDLMMLCEKIFQSSKPPMTSFEKFNHIFESETLLVSNREKKPDAATTCLHNTS